MFLILEEVPEEEAVPFYPEVPEEETIPFYPEVPAEPGDIQLPIAP